MKNVSIARVTVVLSVFLLFGHAAFSEPTASPANSPKEETNSLSPEVSKKIDEAVTRMLSESGVPSASIAVVKDGILTYTKAYGLADIESHRSATTSMIYSIGSISKQFTAASILLLAEEGKLSLDDPVGRWLPDQVAEGRQLSRPAALDRLLARYLAGAVYSTPTRMARVFGRGTKETAQAVARLAKAGRVRAEVEVTGWPGSWVVSA